VGVSLGNETVTMSYINGESADNVLFPSIHNATEKIKLYFDSNCDGLLGEIGKHDEVVKNSLRKQILAIQNPSDFSSIINKDHEGNDVHLYTMVMVYYLYLKEIIRKQISKNDRIEMMLTVPVNMEDHQIEFLLACFSATPAMDSKILFSSIIYHYSHE